MNDICSLADSVVSVSVACSIVCCSYVKCYHWGEVHLYSTIFAVFSESMIISEFKSEKEVI